MSAPTSTFKMYTSDKNILLLIELLKFKKVVSSDAEFAHKIETLPQSITKIKKGTSHFTPMQIESVCKLFNVNANWVFGMEESVFNDEKSIKNKDIKRLLDLIG